MDSLYIHTYVCIFGLKMLTAFIDMEMTECGADL